MGCCFDLRLSSAGDHGPHGNRGICRIACIAVPSVLRVVNADSSLVVLTKSLGYCLHLDDVAITLARTFDKCEEEIFIQHVWYEVQKDSQMCTPFTFNLNECDKTAIISRCLSNLKKLLIVHAVLELPVCNTVFRRTDNTIDRFIIGAK